MAVEHQIRNPLEWGVDQVRLIQSALGLTGRALDGAEADRYTALPLVRRIEVADLRMVLVKGLADFSAARTDVLFLCLIYPVVGLFLMYMAFGYEMLPLLFPMASGFALFGLVIELLVDPIEASRRRCEEGCGVTR